MDGVVVEIIFVSLVLGPCFSIQNWLYFRCQCHVLLVIWLQWLDAIFKMGIVVPDSQHCYRINKPVPMKLGWAYNRKRRSLVPCHST